MNKNINLIIGSGIIGAYLSKELLQNNEKVIVTSRKTNKIFENYKYLKIQNKVNFIKLNVIDKNSISKIIDKFNPKKIFYFSGVSSLTKSEIQKEQTFESHFIGSKNFIEIIKSKNLKIKFYKANSGYIFTPKNGLIDLRCKLSESNNPYIKSQQKIFKLIKKYRNKGLKLSNLIFLQVESPLRPNDFFIKKVCIGAKRKRKITVGNINTYRDYSWVSEIAKSIFLTSNLVTKDYIISAGKKISGKEIIKTAYALNNLDYKKYYSVNKKLIRKNEKKILVGSSKNILFLKKNFNFNFKIYGNKLVKEMFKSI